VFAALSKTYGFLTPDLWAKHALQQTPYQEHTDFLSSTAKLEYGRRAVE
jgi:hypothetical protein